MHQYNHKGQDVFILQGRGGRRRGLLSRNEEEELLEELRERGERGAVVIAKTIREYAAKKLGTEVSKDYAYDLLHRHGWRKIEPRSRHPKSDSENRKSLKKLPEIVASSVRTLAEEDTRPLKVFFQDEARFGRMSNPARCWASADFSPIVPMQRVREYTYIYGAVCPADGESFSLILPSANTEMMTLYLREFSLFYKDYRIVMVMDGSPWHKAKDLETFENIRIIFQPSYSPELNPAEHLWEHFVKTISKTCSGLR